MTRPGGAGWYPDPWGTPKNRWFDGEAWTPRVWPPEDSEAPPTARRAPSRDVGDDQRLGRMLATVMPVAAAAMIATAISGVAVLRWVADNWDEFVEATESGRRLEPEVAGWVSTLSWVGQFPLFAIQLLFLLWCYKTARAGRELGIPARRSPGWAVGSWLIPILNLWWPYQSVSDTVPADDPARTEIRRWWTLWLAMLASTLFVFASAFFAVTASLLAVVVQGALVIAAAIAARRMIVAVLVAHRTV